MPIYAAAHSDVPYLSNNASFEDIDINAGTIASGTLNLNVIGTNTSNLRYVFPGGFTIASGASVSVACPTVSVLMPEALQTFTDNVGRSTSPSGDVSVTISTYGYNNQISVSGSLTANGTIFGGGGGGATIQVNAGGHLAASNSTFNIGSLTLDNSSVLNSGDLDGRHIQHANLRRTATCRIYQTTRPFEDIDINASAPLPVAYTETSKRRVIGTNTSNLRYVFPRWLHNRLRGRP